MIYSIRLIGFIGLLVGTFSANSTPEEAQKFVETLSQQVAHLSTQPRAAQPPLLENTLKKFFDIPALAAFCLGPLWREFSAENHALYLHWFLKDLMNNYYQQFLHTPYHHKNLVFDTCPPLQPEDGEWHVTSTFSQDGKSYTVIWVVFATPKGLKIADILVENLSLMQTKREEIQALIAQRTTAEILDLFRKPTVLVLS